MVTSLVILRVRQFGVIPFDEADSLMRELHALRSANAVEDHLLVLEHPPVITKGRRMRGERLPREEDILGRGIAVRETDRGGLLTYHGPGQVVVYFVLKLEDYFGGVSAFVAFIEKTLVSFLARNGVPAATRPDHPGVWVASPPADGDRSRKIASIGLRVERGVTRHGAALNIANDLGVYRLFDPCGLTGDSMTSMAETLGRPVGAEELAIFKKRLAARFQDGLATARETRARS